MNANPAIASGLSARRALIEGQRNALHTTDQLDALFHPKQASDVLVNEGFITPNEDWAAFALLGR